MAAGTKKGLRPPSPKGRRRLGEFNQFEEAENLFNLSKERNKKMRCNISAREFAGGSPKCGFLSFGKARRVTFRPCRATRKVLGTFRRGEHGKDQR
jgi:hypothetical protein